MSVHEHITSDSYGKNRSALVFALAITVVIMAVEVVGGLLSGSLALLSDAGHMLTDAGALGLALFALYFSRKPATDERTYGFYRLEVLSALLNGALLILIAGFIFFEAFQRFFHPRQVDGVLMLAVAAVGLLANLLAAAVLSRGSRENINVKGALFHVLSDAFSSCGVLVGGLVIIFRGYLLIDPIIGAVIGILILRGAFELVTESVDILLESTPRDVSLSAVAGAIKKTKGVLDVHDLHIWTIAPGLHALSTHIHVDDALLSDCGDISKEIKVVLRKKFRITHVTLEFECEKCKGPIICPIEKED
jgi:cobalt-zinc-cadmium efflux system protein